MLRKIESSIWQFGSIIQDKLFRRGCDFGKWVMQDEMDFDKAHGNQYQPSTTTNLKRVLKRMNITSDDSIIDIGCGKGRAMYVMSRFPFGKICGYDLSSDLVSIAEENFRKLDISERCHVQQADAELFEGYDEFNYFYFFNSVPREVFIKMIGHVQESIERKPRKVVFIYMHPEQEDYLLANTDMKKMDHEGSFVTPLVDWFDLACYTNEL